VRWFDIRARHVEAIGAEDVERGHVAAPQVRAHRLADMGKRCGLTQREVAQLVGVLTVVGGDGVVDDGGPRCRQSARSQGCSRDRRGMLPWLVSWRAWYG
jgi:hypothetical protein